MPKLLSRLHQHASHKRYLVLRYLVAGGTGAACNFFLLYTLTEYAHWWYILSSLAATSAATAASFILQKFWTFQNNTLTRMHVQIPLYLLLAFANIILNAAFLYLLVQYLSLWYIFAQVVSALLLAMMNFFIYRSHIFV